jgi:hypothetical protein
VFEFKITIITSKHLTCSNKTLKDELILDRIPLDMISQKKMKYVAQIGLARPKLGLSSA